MYDQFVGMVAAGRHMDPAKVTELADGRAFTGRQALALGLVDEMGGEDEAREWLARTHQVSTALPIGDLRNRSRFERLVGSVTGMLTGAVMEATLGARTLPSGAWAVWQGVSE